MPDIDPRCKWIVNGPAPAGKAWRLVRVRYADEAEAGGRINIYVTVVDANGAPVSGVKVIQQWPDDRAPAYTVGGTCDFVMSGDSSFNPDRGEHGPYAVYVGDGPSDVVAGFGLPLRRHVCYYVTFQMAEAEPTPTPPPTPAGDYVTRTELAALLRKMADDLTK